MFGFVRKATLDNTLAADALRALTQEQKTSAELREELARERAARYYVQTRMAELKTEHAEAVSALESRLTVAQSNFEWLANSHNQLAGERASLMLEKTGIGVAVPTIQVRRDVENGGVGMGEPLADVDTPTLAALASAGDFFDDMGDRAATIAGVRTQDYSGIDSLLREQ